MKTTPGLTDIVEAFSVFENGNWNMSPKSKINSKLPFLSQAAAGPTD